MFLDFGPAGRQVMTLLDCLTSNQNYAYVKAMQKVSRFLFDLVMIILGPVLVLVVFTIVALELYAFFEFLLPAHGIVFLSWAWVFNTGVALFLAVNLIFNYVLCVSTNPGTHDSPEYHMLIAEAREEGLIPRSGGTTRLTSTEDKAALVQRQRGPAASPHARPARLQAKSWIDQDAYEWGFCRRTKLPKAPRSHFDHVTNKLVLNMDHYCPWMFNTIGYLNYRYFVFFLFYVFITCVYGVLLTGPPFVTILHRHHGNFKMKLANEPTSAVAYTFVLALSIGLAVAILFSWHLYLVSSAQTTIEFYGNQTKHFRARMRGRQYRNPYSLGFRGNWRHFLGSSNIVLALLPSTRKPSWPPWPRRDSSFAPLPSPIQNGHIV